MIITIAKDAEVPDEIAGVDITRPLVGADGRRAVAHPSFVQGLDLPDGCYLREALPANWVWNTEEV